MHKTLEGKSVLVTGSSRGIGRGIAVRLAERGARVCVNYRQDEDAARHTLAAVERAGSTGFIVQADVSRREDVAMLATRVQEQFGTLDVYVSNALGNLLGFLSPPFIVSLAQFDEAFACQARAFFMGVQALNGLMRDAGRIIALSYWPGSHLGGFQPYFAMGANKAAVEAMCRYYAVALARRGITVNAVCAGLTDDSIVNQLPPPARDALLGRLRDGWTPMGRPGTPADIGGAVAALCGDDAAWITGQTIVADGGASLMSPEAPLDFQRA
ncbi:3-ketoacyl-ACP reductase [Luteitalea sp. TBR-22]|uniref:SDR family oxidoreductase n=1 Tax=Luteitalea sp. TBR-22 TaxID=2802971 RepID=UPI001AF83B8F|nr:SDR family oxidoreductase [Luteitalea sp. TBR-22]BCS34964.1 3-ketoacyl-ACP reductase [Luteitalea sp. TBR-22]